MSRTLKCTGSLTAFALSAALILIGAGSSSGFSGVPQVSNFQGMATDSAGHRLPDGTIILTLRYYTASTGGTFLYAEQFYNVPVKGGVFNVVMGTGTMIGVGSATSFSDAIRAFNTVFAETSVNSDTPMVPRIQILAAPYAVRAYTSDYLGGMPASQFLDTTSTAQTKAGGLTLNGSSPTGGALLNVSQMGSGIGISASGYIGVAGFTSTGGGGVLGRASTTFLPGTYGVSGTNDGAFGLGVVGSVYGNGSSTGNGAIGVSGTVGYPYLDHAFNYAAGVRGQSGVGDGVQGASTTHSGVYGFSNATGVYGVAVFDSAVNNGSMWGVYGVADSANAAGVGGDSSAGTGVLGRSNSSWGVFGRSESGVGVHGQSASGSGPGIGVEGSAGAGTGVSAIATAAGGVAMKATAHGADGVALQIDNGPIKVSGANPTAFVVYSPPPPTSNTNFMIDNPLTNNDPTALLIVTQNWNPNGQDNYVGDPHPYAVFWNPVSRKWGIVNVDSQAIPANAGFNVLVIKK